MLQLDKENEDKDKMGDNKYKRNEILVKGRGKCCLLDKEDGINRKGMTKNGKGKRKQCMKLTKTVKINH